MNDSLRVLTDFERIAFRFLKGFVGSSVVFYKKKFFFSRFLEDFHFTKNSFPFRVDFHKYDKGVC